MSGLRIAIPGANFTHYVDRIAYPDIADLTSLYFLGGTEADSIQNRAPGVGGSGSVTGSVTYGDYWGIFSGQSYENYIEIPEFDNVADMTLLSVHRMPNAAGGAPAGRPILGVWGGTANGDNLMHDGLLAVTSGAGNSYPKFTGSAGAASQPNFHFRAAVVEGTNISAYHVVAGAVTVGQTVSFARGTDAVTQYRIGGRITSTAGYADTAYIAMVAKHAAPLSVPQLQEVYDFVRAYYARRGLTVL